MKDDPHPAKAGKEDLSRFFTATLFLTAIAAEAQGQETKLPEVSEQTPKTEIPVTKTDNDDKSGTTLTLGAGEVISLTSEKDQTQIFSDFTPNVEVKTTNKHGDYAKFSAMESMTLNNKDYNALTIKFMVELGKQLGNGSQIIFKAGRESTEAGNVYDVAMHHYADAQNIGTFGNLSNVMAVGYSKNGIYTELGIIGSTDEGLYVIPNPKQASFWAKGGLTLLQKSGVELYMNGATRLGGGHKDLLASIGIKTDNGFRARAIGKYDFVERSGALCADAVKDVKKGLKIMAGTVLKDKGNEFRLHCGVDVNNVQFSVQYVKEKDQKGTVNLTAATKLNWVARSKLNKNK